MVLQVSEALQNSAKTLQGHGITGLSPEILLERLDRSKRDGDIIHVQGDQAVNYRVSFASSGVHDLVDTLGAPSPLYRHSFVALKFYKLGTEGVLRAIGNEVAAITHLQPYFSRWIHYSHGHFPIDGDEGQLVEAFVFVGIWMSAGSLMQALDNPTKYPNVCDIGELVTSLTNISDSLSNCSYETLGLDAWLHGDIKPQNLIVSREHNNFLKIIGFGKFTKLADKLVKSDHEWLNTPEYAPQDMRSLDSDGHISVSTRIDEHCFGIVILELVASLYGVPCTATGTISGPTWAREAALTALRSELRDVDPPCSALKPVMVVLTAIGFLLTRPLSNQLDSDHTVDVVAKQAGRISCKEASCYLDKLGTIARKCMNLYRQVSTTPKPTTTFEFTVHLYHGDFSIGTAYIDLIQECADLLKDMIDTVACVEWQPGGEVKLNRAVLSELEKVTESGDIQSLYESEMAFSRCVLSFTCISEAFHGISILQDKLKFLYLTAPRQLMSAPVATNLPPLALPSTPLEQHRQEEDEEEINDNAQENQNQKDQLQVSPRVTRASSSKRRDGSPAKHGLKRKLDIRSPPKEITLKTPLPDSWLETFKKRFAGAPEAFEVDKEDWVLYHRDMRRVEFGEDAVGDAKFPTLQTTNRIIMRTLQSGLQRIVWQLVEKGADFKVPKVVVRPSEAKIGLTLLLNLIEEGNKVDVYISKKSVLALRASAEDLKQWNLFARRVEEVRNALEFLAECTSIVL